MFTVIIATHDRPLLLARTLRSLIAQTYQDFTVVIVSDSAAYIPPYQELKDLAGRYVYMIRSGTPGPAESRNLGLDIVRSRYVLFIDDDDTFEPGHLQALADAIAANKEPELLFTSFNVQYEDRSKEPIAFLSREQIPISGANADSTFVMNRIPNSCIAYRDDVVKNVRHETDMRIYEDWDFLMRCLQGGRQFVYVPAFTVNIHKSPPTAPENLRRGNTRDDLVVEVTLQLFQRFPSPNANVLAGRRELLDKAGMPYPAWLK